MNIKLSQSAVSDLQDIKDYYVEEGVSEVGLNFVSDILTHIERLMNYPDIGRRVPEFDENHIRELIHPPYRIVYLRDDNSVQVIRVWRSERLLELSE